MPSFHYVALNKAGSETKGQVHAPDEGSARREIKKMGFYVVSIGLEGKKLNLKNALKVVGGNRVSVSTKELVFFIRQLSTLLKSGFTLDDALNTISEQITSPSFNRAIIEIDQSVKEGKTFHESLGAYPAIFSDIFRSLVKAGEASGELPAILHQLAEYMEEQSKLKNKITATLMYPLFMVFTSIIVVVILMTYVIPNIVSVLTSAGQELPWNTRLLIDGSEFFGNYIVHIFLALLAIFIVLKQYYKTTSGRKMVDGVLLHLPIFGSLTTKIGISRFASTFSVLLRSGVDILKAMNIVKDVMGNVVLRKSIEDSISSVSEGKSIAGPLKATKVFPPIVIKMIESGQKSGNLELMLDAIARDYDNEVENSIMGLTSLLEPAIILIMGIVVSFIVVSILSPMMQMTQMS
ncbi:MAG: type II secretion system F family protein [Candidatus Cloacimonetes bacterium]|nr:type II secretion system F family protein [Candidatus Cloacimonadota bacterium]